MLKYQPADWDKYTPKQRENWYTKPYEERRIIILQSYMNMIVGENGDLDKFKILELLLDLEDRIESCERGRYCD